MLFSRPFVPLTQNAVIAKKCLLFLAFPYVSAVLCALSVGPQQTGLRLCERCFSLLNTQMKLNSEKDTRPGRGSQAYLARGLVLRTRTGLSPVLSLHRSPITAFPLFSAPLRENASVFPYYSSLIAHHHFHAIHDFPDSKQHQHLALSNCRLLIPDRPFVLLA